MSVMFRYLKSKVENNHAYLILTKCEFCPYFMKNKDTGVIACAFSRNEDLNTNIISNDMKFKFNGGVWTTETRINIPEWCKLNTNINIEKRKNKIVFKYNGIIHESVSIDDEFKKRLIVPDGYIRYKEYTEDLVYNTYYNDKVKNRTTTSDNNSETKPIYALPVHNVNTPTYTTSVRVVLNVCSNCGVGKEEVDRNVNDGMCEECYNEYKNNKEILYVVRINNFRLKRNSFWSENKFKVVKDLVF